jgi:hypothetical protein
VEGVKLIDIFVLVLFLPLATAQEHGVSWSSIDPFCGKLTSAEPEAFPIRAATVKLYRAKAKHLPCCDHAEPLGNVRIGAKGRFDLCKVPPGQYWLIATWNKTKVPVPLWFDGKYNFACDERFNQVIEIKPTAKSATITAITSSDSLTHAQTH